LIYYKPEHNTTNHSTLPLIEDMAVSQIEEAWTKESKRLSGRRALDELLAYLLQSHGHVASVQSSGAGGRMLGVHRGTTQLAREAAAGIPAAYSPNRVTGHIPGPLAMSAAVIGAVRQPHLIPDDNGIY
ncbi:hypothetical protein BGW38_008691, partial [Lunasporangiospora selenospora]